MAPESANKQPETNATTVTLELLTEERERTQNALYCCGVHKERAKKAWRYRERAPDSTEYPLLTELDR